MPHLLGVALRLHGQVARQSVERVPPEQRPTTDCAVVLNAITDAQRRELLQLLETLEREPVNDASEATLNGETPSSSRGPEDRSEKSVILLSSDDDEIEAVPPKRARRAAPGDGTTLPMPLFSRPQPDLKNAPEGSGGVKVSEFLLYVAVSFLFKRKDVVFFEGILCMRLRRRQYLSRLLKTQRKCHCCCLVFT